MCKNLIKCGKTSGLIQRRIHDFPGGRQPIIWPKFAENCMKMKTIGPKGEGAGVEGALPEFYYVHPPILSSFISHLQVVGILLIQTACAIGS